MIAVLLIVHLFVTLALIGVVLIQRSEGGGLGIGSSQGMGSFMSGRGTANLLTRTTAVLATIFMGLSLTLALLNRGTGGVGRSILAEPPPVTSPLSGTGPSGLVPSAPQSPAPASSAPLGSGSQNAAPPGPTSGGTTPAPAPGPSVPTN